LHASTAKTKYSFAAEHGASILEWRQNMVKFKTKFLIALTLVFLCNNIYALDKSSFIGIWKCTSTKNQNDDAYIAIKQTKTGDFFVLYIDPFWKHQLDYAEYGKLIDGGYIFINSKENFYIEITKLGSLLHYWCSLEDPNPSRFEKISDDSLIVNNLIYLKNDLLLFLKSLEK